MASSSSTASLAIHPESELKFELSAAEATPRCSMTLEHPGKTDEPLAFKVKTTQPRRYLVRPNQGVIASGGRETVQILLVEKDKNALWQSFERLGASALQTKDKFLVQSCAVSQEFAQQYDPAGNGYQALTQLWTQVGSAKSGVPLANKKLHVQHIVKSGNNNGSVSGAANGNGSAAVNGTSSAASTTPSTAGASNVANMTNEQLVQEVSSLRRKYDELVAFSVNLTAERDILNNTLEQTKRDLNRELLKTSAGDHTSGASGTGNLAKQAPRKSSGSTSKALLLLVALCSLILGIKLQDAGSAGPIRALPGVKALFTEPVEEEAKSSSRYVSDLHDHEDL